MLSILAIAALTSAYTKIALSQGVSCTNYGLAACPYAEATTADLTALIDKFCGVTGGNDYYKYTEDIEASLPDGYYQVTSDRPGAFSQETCTTDLNYIVSECDATGQFWATGEYENADGITFSVTPCELA